ncbi:MAG: M23 family metallopeptidase [Chitinophagaceae bacterium]
MRKVFFVVLILKAGIVTAQSAEDKAFEHSKGTWKFPIDKITGIDTVPDVIRFFSDPSFSIIIKTDTATNVYSLQPGIVRMVTMIGDVNAVIVSQGTYFLAYSNLENVAVKKGDTIAEGQVIGKLAMEEEGRYELEFGLSHGDKTDKKAQLWFCKDFRDLLKLKNIKAYRAR